jgi:hypothetical protein
MGINIYIEKRWITPNKHDKIKHFNFSSKQGLSNQLVTDLRTDISSYYLIKLKVHINFIISLIWYDTPS